MEKPAKSFILNLGLLLSAILTVFTGLLIQVKYHLGNHGFITINEQVYGISYNGWSGIHKSAIVVLSLVMVFHFSLHWKWYKAVIKKGLVAKNQQVLVLSLLFVLAAITGFVPWFIDLTKGNELHRKVFIEIHDKLALFLSVYLVLHVINRMKWFFSTFKKMINKPSKQNGI